MPSMDLCHHQQLCKLSACGTSKWTMGVSSAGMGLALAAGGSVGRHTWRLGWVLGCFHSSHSKSRCVTPVVLIPDFSGSAPTDQCWWLWEHSTWGTPRPTACIPTVEVRPRAVQTTVSCVSPHNRRQVTAQKILLGGNLQQRNPWGSCPSRSTPILPASNRSSEADVEASTPTAGKQTLPLTGLWQPQSKEEDLLNSQCSLWSSKHQSNPLSRG